MASLDEGHVEKKFKNVSVTQESIQSISLWVIHHKAQHEKIVDIWFNVLKKSKLDHRLTLFYLANDIVQTCRKKHAVMYKDAFKEVLKDATLLVRDSTIRPPIERIFEIWKERGIYDAEFADELVAIINNTKVRATMNSKLLSEFQPLTLMEKIITLKRFEDEIELKRRQLRNLRLDASSIEAVKQLKDRTHGGEFCAEFEGACTKMEDYVNSLEKEISDRVALIEMLEQSELYYDAQYGEAKIVANAYKNFGTRVNNLKRKLEEKMVSLPDSVSPIPSPTMDAPSPSPESSPEHDDHKKAHKLEPRDSDHYSNHHSSHQHHGSHSHHHHHHHHHKLDLEEEYKPDSPLLPDITSPIPPGVTTPEYAAPYQDHHLSTSQQHASYDSTVNTEAVDMEMSDDEDAQNKRGSAGGSSRNQRGNGFNATESRHFKNRRKDDDLELSPKSDDDFAGPQGSPLVVDREDKKSANYVKRAPPSFLDEILKSGSGRSSAGLSASSSTHKEDDDGGSTPVMDEFEGSGGRGSSELREEKASKPVKQNPIDFLTQLIGQTKKNTITGEKSSFLENLSMLTKTVQTQYKDNEDKDGIDAAPQTTADSWAAWKAQNAPSPADIAAPAPPPPTQEPVPPPMPDMPPPPKIHPTLLPPPTPPFPGPLPPPPFPPSQSDHMSYPPPPRPIMPGYPLPSVPVSPNGTAGGFYGNQRSYMHGGQGFPPHPPQAPGTPGSTNYPQQPLPPQPDGSYTASAPEGANYPARPQDSNFTSPTGEQPELHYPPPSGPTTPQGARFPSNSRQADPSYPSHGDRYSQPSTPTSTTPTYPPSVPPQNSGYPRQTTPPSPFPNAPPGFDNNYGGRPRFPPPPNQFPPSSYAGPSTPTQSLSSPNFMPPPPTPPNSSGPRPLMFPRPPHLQAGSLHGKTGPTPQSPGQGAPPSLLHSQVHPVPMQGGISPAHPPHGQTFHHRPPSLHTPTSSHSSPSSWNRTDTFNSGVQDFNRPIPRSNLTTIRTIDDHNYENDHHDQQESFSDHMPSPNFAKISTFNDSKIPNHQSKNPFSPRPPSLPPNSHKQSLQNPIASLLGMKHNFSSGGEGQQEFIEKLKRKSNTVNMPRDDDNISREEDIEPNFNSEPISASCGPIGSNLRTLTQVDMDISSGEEGDGSVDSNKNQSASKALITTTGPSSTVATAKIVTSNTVNTLNTLTSNTSPNRTASSKDKTVVSNSSSNNKDNEDTCGMKDTGNKVEPDVSMAIGGYLQKLRAESESASHGGLDIPNKKESNSKGGDKDEDDDTDFDSDLDDEEMDKFFNDPNRVSRNMHNQPPHFGGGFDGRPPPLLGNMRFGGGFGRPQRPFNPMRGDFRGRDGRGGGQQWGNRPPRYQNNNFIRAGGMNGPPPLLMGRPFGNRPRFRQNRY